uniref:Uncharacterized protein AlNc14C18G1865 n=1 Tax=Albugo laibachii Nc14 TaxID=890382 RepID=F0W4P4_9STRA|nr:conserved hypothetical protein [Albugo laibachii Nc14]|eukprot:CCA16078.1 conserved hypothetical protein [Albugo laibachii Nc14]
MQGDARGRKRLFHAKAGLTLEDQRHLAAQLQFQCNDTLSKVIKVRSESCQQHNALKENGLKFEWIKEHKSLQSKARAVRKSIETLILKVYNSTVESNRSRMPRHSESTKKALDQNNQDCDQLTHAENPEMYASQIEELLRQEQIHLAAHRRQVLSNFEERTTMKDLMRVFLKETQMSSPKDTDSTEKAYIADEWRQQARDFILEVIVGHELVGTALQDEIEIADADYNNACVELLTSLRLPPHQTALEGMESVQSILQAIPLLEECADRNPTLHLEIIMSFQDLMNELEVDLRQLKSNFFAQASLPDAAKTLDAAKSLCGGWNAHEEERFLHVYKVYEHDPLRSDLFALFRTVLPALTSDDDIKSHIKFHQLRRFYHQKAQDRRQLAKRKVAQAQEKANRKIEMYFQQEKWQAKKQENKASRDKCAQLRGKVFEWQDQKEAHERVLQHQREIDSLHEEKDKFLQDEDKKHQHRIHKGIVRKYRQQKLNLHIEQEHEKREMEKAALRRQQVASVRNNKRVEYRSTKIQQKIKHQKESFQLVQMREEERTVRLEAIKQQTPYAAAVAQIEADPARLMRETAAFRANIDAAPESILFPVQGYDCDTLFRNARFKLGIALRVYT